MSAPVRVSSTQPSEKASEKEAFLPNSASNPPYITSGYGSTEPGVEGEDFLYRSPTFEAEPTPLYDSAWRRQIQQRQLLVCLLCVLIGMFEVAGGLRANSLSLITHAAHMWCDATTNVVSLLGLFLMRHNRDATAAASVYRMQIKAQVLASLLLLGATVVLDALALHRVYLAIAFEYRGKDLDPAFGVASDGEIRVDGPLMFTVAGISLILTICRSVAAEFLTAEDNLDVPRVSASGVVDGDDTEATPRAPSVKPFWDVGSSSLHALRTAFYTALVSEIVWVAVVATAVVVWVFPRWCTADAITTLVFGTIAAIGSVPFLANNLKYLYSSHQSRYISDLIGAVRRIPGVMEVTVLDVYSNGAITAAAVTLVLHPEFPDTAWHMQRTVEMVLKRSFGVARVTVQVRLLP